jgi:hypothetical protein
LTDGRLLHAGLRASGRLQTLRTARLRGRTGWRGRTRSSNGSRLLWLTRSLQLLTLPVRRAGLLRRLRLTGPVLQLLSGTVLLTGLRLTGAILQAGLLPRPVLSRQSILTRPARRVATVEAGVGAPEGALLVDDAAAEILRRVKLADKTLVA